MKLLWLLKSELNSNRKSATIFILQLVFAIVCYNICLSLTGKYIGSLSYFKKHDTSNAVKIIYQGDALEQADSLIKSQEVERGFYAIDGGVQVSNKQGKLIEENMPRSIMLMSREYFEQFGDISHSGRWVDTDKDYGGSIPAMIASDVAGIYKIGNTYNVDGKFNIYICGMLKNSVTELMVSGLSTPSFILFDESGVVKDYLLSSGVNYTNLYADLDSSIDKDAFMSEYNRDSDGEYAARGFDWEEELGSEFDRISSFLLIGIAILAISSVGFISNSILDYKGNERDYAIQIITGAQIKTIAITSIAKKVTILIASSVISIPLLVSLGKLLELDIMTANSFILAVTIAGILSAISILLDWISLKGIAPLEIVQGRNA